MVKASADVPRCPRCRKTRARPVDTPWSLQTNSFLQQVGCRGTAGASLRSAILSIELEPGSPLSIATVRSQGFRAARRASSRRRVHPADANLHQVVTTAGGVWRRKRSGVELDQSLRRRRLFEAVARLRSDVALLGSAARRESALAGSDRSSRCQRGEFTIGVACLCAPYWFRRQCAFLLQIGRHLRASVAFFRGCWRESTFFAASSTSQ